MACGVVAASTQRNVSPQRSQCSRSGPIAPGLAQVPEHGEAEPKDFGWWLFVLCFLARLVCGFGGSDGSRQGAPCPRRAADLVRSGRVPFGVPQQLQAVEQERGRLALGNA
jgi:hypothetical protein